TLHLRLPAQLPLGTDLAGHPGDFRGEGVELIDHDVDRVLEFEDLALDLDRDLLGQVALLNGRGDLGNVANLRRQVGGQLVDVVGEILPGAGRTQDIRLSAQAALGADLASHAGDLAGKGVELVHHAIDRVLQVEDLTADVDGDLLGEVALGDGCRHLCDVAHLGGEVGGDVIDVVGEVFPGPDDGRDGGLAAQPAFGTHLACHATDFRGEGVQLVDHDIDGVLQLEDLAADFNGDLLGEVALLHRGRDLSNVAHLGGEIGGELIHLQGEVFPGPRRTRHAGLTAEPALGAHLAGHPGNLAGERVELVDHRVDGVLQPEDLAANVNGDLLREVALGDGGRDLGDVTHLGGEVAGHVVDVVGEVLPASADAAHLRLAVQLALGAHLAGHASDLRGEGVELVDHGVDRVLELQDLAANVDRDLLRQIALGDSSRDVGDVPHLGREVGGHQVDVVGEILPDASRALDVSLSA